jgi:hypothetical protein
MCGWGVVELLRPPAKGVWNFVFFCWVLGSEVKLCLVMCHAVRMYGLLEAWLLAVTRYNLCFRLTAQGTETLCRL